MARRAPRGGIRGHGDPYGEPPAGAGREGAAGEGDPETWGNGGRAVGLGTVDADDVEGRNRRSERAERLAAHYGGIEALNRHIAEAMRMIKSSPAGVHLEEIRYMLGLSHDEASGLAGRLRRIDGVDAAQEGPARDPPDPVFRYAEPADPPEGGESSGDGDVTGAPPAAPQTESLAVQMVNDYADSEGRIHKGLRQRLTKDFIRLGTVKAVMNDNPEFTREEVALHVRTSMRLPDRLKEMENDGSLHPYPDCSLQIALFAADYYGWDGDAGSAGPVVDLAVSLSRHMSGDKDLDERFRARRRARETRRPRETPPKASLPQVSSGCAAEKVAGDAEPAWKDIRCPRCYRVAESRQDAEEWFGFRTMGGMTRPQSWCKVCRRKRRWSLPRRRAKDVPGGTSQWTAGQAP